MAAAAAASSTSLETITDAASNRVVAASSSASSPFRLVEKTGDLFTCDAKASLAHCVSACLAMSKGVAVPFKEKFGSVAELKAQHAQMGQVAVLQRDERFIYYLITKARFFHKPTYASLEQSLVCMRDHMQTHGVTQLAIPRIGCGLDGLKWDQVTAILQRIFKGMQCELTVYTL